MDRRAHYTRKNFIFISVAFFFSLFFMFVALTLDPIGGMANANNPFLRLTQSLGFPTIDAGLGIYAMAVLSGFYIFVFVSIVIYIGRLAIFNGKKPYSLAYMGYYLLSFLLCLFLSLGVGTLIQMPITSERILLELNYVGQTLFVSLLFYAVVALSTSAAISLVLNIKNIDRPFRFFKNLKDEDLYPLKEDKPIEEKLNPLPPEGDKDEGIASGSTVVASTPAVAKGVAGVALEAIDGSQLEREKVFPGLSTIDHTFGGMPSNELVSTEISLKELCSRFRDYLALDEKLYFDIETIRTFISAFSASRLIILEGLSGTGKSSLPRYFAKFISEDAFFIPVQATRRDKSNLLGFFNDFSRTYNETEFLKRLYEASYKKSEINIMVLDELNISRIEYYFADFLSVLEYPSSDRKISLMQLPYGFIPPVYLQEGVLLIPENTFFVGTANKDDSTYTITDKVYDRAIAIDFDDRNSPFAPESKGERVKLGYADLEKKFSEAKSVKINEMNEADYAKFKKITDYTYDTFDITFGNRILNQIDNFVPVYVACGGSKDEALDFMFSRKVLSKVQGRFEDYIKGGLQDLKSLLQATYGKGVFKKSEATIDKLLKKL
jgi:hypothetical protein